MKVFRECHLPPSVQQPVVTIGNFDGQHVGHQALLKATLDVAHTINGKPVVLTFDPHPIQVLRPEVTLQFLSTFEEKLVWFERNGVEAVVVLTFSREFAGLTPEQFAQDILQKGLRARAVVVGQHFVFGARRSGNIDDLMRLGTTAGFQVHTVPPVRIGGDIASSTRIRETLQRGEIEKANQLLGRPYMLNGRVVEGAHRGEELGCPTANLRLPSSRAIPADGIYATILQWNHQFFHTVSYIGTRPTFGPGERILEVHVLDHSLPLYGEEIEVYFLQWIRGDATFESSQDLAKQMEDDVKQARTILEKIPLSMMKSVADVSCQSPK